MPENPIQKMLRDADALDKRRQEQIAEQVKVINRVMKGKEIAEEYIRLHGNFSAFDKWRDEHYPAVAAGDQPQESDQK
jgi:hypothetical protein